MSGIAIRTDAEARNLRVWLLCNRSATTKMVFFRYRSMSSTDSETKWADTNEYLHSHLGKKVSQLREQAWDMFRRAGEIRKKLSEPEAKACHPLVKTRCWWGPAGSKLGGLQRVNMPSDTLTEPELWVGGTRFNNPLQHVDHIPSSPIGGLRGTKFGSC